MVSSIRYVDCARGIIIKIRCSRSASLPFPVSVFSSFARFLLDPVGRPIFRGKGHIKRATFFPLNSFGLSNGFGDK